jgi:hypothetical protein
MNGCKYIQKRIDEADKPDLLPFDVTAHIGQCTECERFATERIALRGLVAGGVRVTAPVNFDAMLKMRLAEVKTRRSVWWLGSPALLRFAAAAACLVVMVFGAQYAGFFSGDKVVPPAAPVAKFGPPPSAVPLPLPPQVVTPPHPVGSYQVATRPPRRRPDLSFERAARAGYLTAEDGGVMLVRGRNGEMDVQMPTVSVGAQPLLYVSAGQRTTRTVGTSF